MLYDIKVDAQSGRVIVHGVNLRWKHQRRSQQNPKGGRVQLDGADVTGPFLACLVNGSQAGGATFRCTVPRGLLFAGDHVLQVELNLSDQTRLRQAVRWTVVGNTEP